MRPDLAHLQEAWNTCKENLWLLEVELYVSELYSAWAHRAPVLTGFSIHLLFSTGSLGPCHKHPP